VHQGSGRAVTQANASSAQDGQFDDDESQTKLTLRPSRERSSSVVTRSKLGVLKAVQLHIRSKHTFIGSPQDQQRSNSTAVTSELPPEAIEPPPPKPPPQFTAADPAAPQTVHDPAAANLQPVEESSHQELVDAFAAARKAQDGAQVLTLVKALRSPTGANADVHLYNAAFQALLETRKPGQPLNVILELYNDMVARSILPSVKTYQLVVLALTQRDAELQRAAGTLKTRNGKKRTAAGWQDVPLSAHDQSRLAQLEAESAASFSSAMTIFASMTAIVSKFKIAYEVYTNLLRSCALHANVDSAIQVFAQLERQPGTLPSPSVYYQLMSTFINAGDVRGAREVFDEFVAASRKGRVNWPDRGPQTDRRAFDAMSDESRSGFARMGQIRLWNKMIEGHLRAGDEAAAIEILEQMMDSPASPMFGPADVPPAASSTFTTVISGFCHSGDVETALAWFERLLAEKGSPSTHPFASSRAVVRPDSVAWHVMLQHLSQAGMVDDFNRLYLKMAELRDVDGLDAPDAILAIHTNLEHLDQNPDIADTDALAKLDFVTENCLPDDSQAARLDQLHVANRIVELYVRHHAAARGADVLEHFVQQHARVVETMIAAGVPATEAEARAYHLRGFLLQASGALLGRSANPPTSVSLPLAMRVGLICREHGLIPHAKVAAFYLHPYYEAKRHGEAIALLPQEWETLALSAAMLDLPIKEGEVTEAPEGFVNAGCAAFLNDLKVFGVSLDQLQPIVISKLLQAIYVTMGNEKLKALLKHLGPDFERHLDLHHLRAFAAVDATRPADPARSRPVTPVEHVRVDREQDRFVNEWKTIGSDISPQTAYSRFESGAKVGVYPTIETIGRLINALGRANELVKVQELYNAAQLLISGIRQDVPGQRSYLQKSWFLIEDQMTTALAHAGQAEQAHVHRTRMIEQGGTPTADAYGALIQCVKDTTDDTANAVALFQEAQARGVQPNVYLYNTVISKLAKARKADYAIELFQQMKAAGLPTTSVTYGAVISACCRVGDAHSAELLFAEMTAQRNFKPRVPPFNTMMQLYTHIKPDRGQVQRYYNAMIEAGISPSAHTYKVSYVQDTC
jgi:pentatricopeptide repeat protein